MLRNVQAEALVPQAPALLVDAAEAARLLCLSARTVWSITSPRGDLPAVRIGRTVRYSRGALAEWVRRHQSGADNGQAHQAERV